MSSWKILWGVVVAALGASLYWCYPPAEKIKLGLDIKGGVHLRLEVDEAQWKGEKTPETLRDAADRALEVLRNRIDALGVTEPLIQREGETGIVVQLPGVTDVRRAREILLSTAQLEFRLVSERDPALYLDAKKKPDPNKIPKGLEYFEGKAPGEEYLLEEVLLTGEYLEDARVRTDQFGKPYIEFRLNAEGGRIFGRVTGANVNRRLAIVLDKKVYSAPVIRSRIPGGSGIIEGGFSDREAADLALVLRAGALPAPLKITSQFVVGPTLGADSVKRSFEAVGLGFLLVTVFMVVYYRRSGLVADLCLILNLVFLLGCLAALKATLTLPGIAGILLTVGMAVDANVLIYERIREELAAGKTPRAAVDAGFKRAWTAILDSHVTTLITAVVLFQFGTGPIKGYAVTLTLGVALSLFTAVVIAKAILDARKHASQISV